MGKYSNYLNITLDDRELEKLKKSSKDNEVKYNFAVRLRRCLIDKQLNQIDVVRETGIAQATINSYINAEAEPKISNLIKLAKSLDVSVNYLLGEHKNSKADNEEIRKRIGLTDNAIKTLEIICKESSKRNGLLSNRLSDVKHSSSFNVIDINKVFVINQLLKSSSFTNDFLEIALKYLSNVYAGTCFANEKGMTVKNIRDKSFSQKRNEALFQLQNSLVETIDNISNEIIEKENSNVQLEDE